MNVMTPKTREQKARYELKKIGCSLKKSRTKNIHACNLGGYRIVLNSCNGIVAGSDFNLDLDEVEAWIKENN